MHPPVAGFRLFRAAIQRKNWLSIHPFTNADNNESVKTGFIVRMTEYETIISTLADRRTGDSIQHELILGRRGSGKSTLLKRIEVEIAENEKLNTRYIPVFPAEEQAGIYRLLDLWEQVLQELYLRSNEAYKVKEYSGFTDEQTYTRYLYSEIHRFCKSKKKKAVLLLDNFDRITGSISDDGHLLRETLTNYRDLVLIAASTRMDEHFWRYDQPYYEFFRRFRLEALSRKESFLLLNHWSDALDFNDRERTKIKDFLKKYFGKVENIRLLTDGLPRTMLLFLKLVLQTDKPVEVDFLKKIMDEITPLYQERLNNLTPQMRKIVYEMAFKWEAVSTKELSAQCKMESKLVAANLNTLTDRHIVETLPTKKRNNMYRLSERFFNMWLIVTQGNPDHKRKARWMSEFLESWYDRQELKNLALQQIKEKYDLSEKCWLQEVEKGDEKAMVNLSLIYYIQNKNKEWVRQFIGKYEWEDTGKIIIEIWAGVFNSVEERAIAACSEKREDEEFLTDLLIHQQKSLVDKLFHHAEFCRRLQAKYTVLYYVSQILNGKENDNNLMLRIPPELLTTVDDLLQHIKQEQLRYSEYC